MKQKIEQLARGIFEYQLPEILLSEEELRIAWENEGKKSFNFCHKCGRWVCDAMYNPDVLECVNCAPIEKKPLYCQHCGEKIPADDAFCRKCGSRLTYGGEEWDDHHR